MEQMMHATSVAFGDRGLLITGASGRGKSGLALDLMSRGANLISDDQTRVTRRDDILLLNAPETLRNMIEARGLGILHAEGRSDVPLVAMLDLDTIETERLPPLRAAQLLGLSIPLLHFSASPYFPASLLHYLKAGPRDC